MELENFSDEIQNIRALSIAILERNKIIKEDIDVIKFANSILSNINRMDEAIEQEQDDRYLAFLEQEQEQYDDFINDEQLFNSGT